MKKWFINGPFDHESDIFLRCDIGTDLYDVANFSVNETENVKQIAQFVCDACNEKEETRYTLKDIIAEANGLKSEDNENPEYDRALCELIARLTPEEGDTADKALAVANRLGIQL